MICCSESRLGIRPTSYGELASQLLVVSILTVCCSFTTLIQQDHENERAEAKAKVEMDVSEDRVEKNFTGALLLRQIGEAALIVHGIKI